MGLYISGTGGSYYRGLPIYDCGGAGDLCSSTTPYVLKDDLDERQIRVSNNGVMTGLPWVSGPVATKNGHLKVSADFLKLDNGGALSMSGKGYGGSNGPGLGSDGNPASGGAHGGNGSYVSGLSQAHSYDAVKLPTDAGSGGGSNGANAGGAGGGILDVTVRENLEFSSGILSSDGLAGAGTNAGGGAGGSLILHTKNLTGAGVTIRTNGGAGNGTGGPGSGGRVAIYYTSITSSGGFNGLGLASRGGGNGSSAGTIYYKADADAQGSLLLDNGVNRHSQGVETPIPLLDVFDDINSRNYGTFIIEAADTYTALSTNINYRVVVAGVLQLPANDPHLTIGSNGYIEWRRSDPFDDWSHITILRRGVLTHSYNSNAETYILDIQTTTLDLSGSINVSGRGYAATEGPGFAGGGHGAAYEGMGGYDVAGTPGSSYGSIKNPNQLGSGGGVSAGGGYIKISTSDLNFTGSIRANGAYGCGAGSGGSIHLTAVNINGSGGSISSTGGDGDICAGGGGGRVAVYYTNTTYLGGIEAINFEIYGGWGNIHGGSGTVFHKTPTDPNGNLLVLNSSRNYNQVITTNIIDETLKFDSIRTDFRGTLKIPSGKTFELPTNAISYRIISEGDFTLPGGLTELIISSGGYLEQRKNTPIVFNKISILQGGVVTHSYNSASRNYIVYLQANDFVLNGLIDVDGRGYEANQGPGKPVNINTGAGYGGYGGNSGLYTNLIAGAPYDIDKIKAPIELGSGSLTNGPAIGTRGGGAIRLEVANKLTLSGSIRANGYGGNCSGATGSGGGSGGSTYITTNIIEGSGGNITSNGGNGPYCVITLSSGTYSSYSYNGSGGRIALIYTTDATYGSGLGIKSLIDYEKIAAFGGTYYDFRGAAAGTIFLKQTGVDTNGRLFYNNGPHSHSQKMETPIHSVGGVLVDSFVTMNQATLLVPAGQTFTLPSSTQNYRMIVEGTIIVPSNDLIIAKGGYLEWRQSALLTLDELTIQNGGILTHSYNYNTKSYYLNIATRLLTLDGGGVIDANRRGFMPETGPGVGGAYGGRTSRASPYGSYSSPNDLGSGVFIVHDSYSDQCIGCLGGGGLVKFVVSDTTTLNGIIDVDGETGSSGGTIFIDTDKIKGATALLRSNGGGGAYNLNAGSGGRIAIHYNTDEYGIPGMNISAFGGYGGAAGTIFYKNKASDLNGHLIIKNTGRTPDPSITTLLPNGGAGEFIDSLVADPSVYVEIPSSQSFTLPNPVVNYKLILSGDILLQGVLNTLTIDRGGVLEFRRPSTAPAFGLTSSNIENIIVNRGGLITSSTNSTAKDYFVNINVNNLILIGTIDVNDRGYSSGPGLPTEELSFKGCSHGGTGGVSRPGQINGRPGYDSITNPNDLGSCTGGGLVNLTISNSLTLNGQIVATGSNDTASGGAVNINTSTIEGSGGIINVNGAKGFLNCYSLSYCFAVPGGGGRISLKYANDLYSGTLSSLNITAQGGSMFYNGFSSSGAAGTVFIKKAIENGTLIMNNGSLPYTYSVETDVRESVTPDNVIIGSSSTGIYVASGVIFDFKTSSINFPIRFSGEIKFSGNNLTLEPRGKLYFDSNDPLILNSVVLEPGSFVSHTANTQPSDSNDKAVYFQASNFHLKTDALIDVSYLGYRNNSGPGSSPSSSVFVHGPILIGGASYGGLGGGTGISPITPPGVTYETPEDPRKNGSGAGSITGGPGFYIPGGVGGGLVIIEATNLTIDGQIKANASDGAYSEYLDNYPGHWFMNQPAMSGGGSGGAINLISTNLYGAFGDLQANGGSVPHTEIPGAGGGGGGRIAVRFTNDFYNGTVNGLKKSVTGGAAYFLTPANDRRGQDGSIFTGP